MEGYDEVPVQVTQKASRVVERGLFHRAPVRALGDLELRAALERIELPKIIFTNACESHAHNVLGLMELESCFNGIIDVYVFPRR